MATFRGLLPETLEPFVSKIFFQEFQQQKLLYPEIFNNKPTGLAFVDEFSVAGLGRFAQKPEGTPAAFSDPVQGDRRRTIVLTFALGFRVTMEMQEDEQHGIIAKMPADLAMAARDSMDRLAWGLINVAFTAADDTAPTGLPEGDGARRSLFDTGHVPLRNPAATQSNRLAPGVALSTAGMETALTTFRTQQSEEERFINIEPNKLLIHPDNEFVAVQLLDSEKEVNTAENQVNTMSRNRIGVSVCMSPYLTDTDAWSLWNTSMSPADWISRKKLTGPERTTDSQSFDSIYISHYRSAVQYNGNWRAAVGSAPYGTYCRPTPLNRGVGTAGGHILSAYDFQVYSAGGETVSRVGYRTNITAATFVTGEPVVDDGTGEAELCGDDPANVLGIALEPAVSTSNRMNALEVTATGDTRRLVDIPTPEKRYVARYFSDDGTNLVAPTQANAIGRAGGFTLGLVGAEWCIDTTAANTHVRIEDVIDANGISLLDDWPAAGAGDRVVFRFL